MMGTQAWRIQSIGHQDVEVVPASAKSAMSPFWRAEERNRDFHVSERIARTLEEWNPRVGSVGFAAEIAASHGLEEGAARALADFLARQKRVTATDLPHRHHLLVEHPREAAVSSGKSAGFPVVLHTLWGGRVNRPLGLALSAGWEERFGERPVLFQNDDAIMLTSAAERSAAEILAIVQPENLERLLRRSLEGSGFFGARFRENAARALLLPRASVRRRMPLWLTRQRAKSLYSAVSAYDDFPLLLETWRTCLRDEFDMETLALLLGQIADGTIRVSEAVTQVASPFCGDMIWRLTSALMYADDTPEGGTVGPPKGGSGRTGLRDDLVREAALSPQLRPLVPARLVGALQSRLQRTAEGYAPRDAREILDLLKERLLIPRAEWEELLAAVERDAGIPRQQVEEELAGKMVTAGIGSPGARGFDAVAAVERMPRIRRSLAPGNEELLADLVAEWLRSYGPVEPRVLAGSLGLSDERLASVLDDLVEEETIVVDRLIEGSQSMLACDRENLERLLRMARSARAKPSAPTLPVQRLPLFAALHHGLLQPQPGSDGLKAAFEKLFGVVAPARLWEEEILPARVAAYSPRLLDHLMQESGLLWFGAGTKRIGFSLPSDTELFLEPAGADAQARCDALFPGSTGRYAFWDLTRRPAGSPARSSSEVAEELWSLAWKGLVSNDSFQPVRRGIAGDFHAEPAARPGGRQRVSRDRWQASRPLEGSWFRVEPGESRDALDEEETSRDRVRQALRRHGVVFREMLENELPLLAWSRLFRSLRLMELSGEVVAGRFFDGVRGIQFASPAALETLAAAAGSCDDSVYWMNAADPASLCGVDLEGLKDRLPQRLPTTHVVFHGAVPGLVSRKRGRELDFQVPPDSPLIPRLLQFVKALAGRESSPLSAVHVQAVNGEPAAASPYAPALLRFGFVSDYKRLTWRPGVSGL